MTIYEAFLAEYIDISELLDNHKVHKAPKGQRKMPFTSTETAEVLKAE